MAIGMCLTLCGGVAAQQTAVRAGAAPATAAQAGSERVGGKVVSDVDGHAMANVMLSVLHHLGHDMDGFGDSTGEFSFSPAPATTVQ